MTAQRRTVQRILAGLLLALLLAPVAGAQEVRAWLDRDRVRLGETVTLNVEAAAGAEAPEFSVLDQDFERLGSSSRSEFSIVNGRRSSRTLWAVVLEPREAGVIGIPAFTVGGASSAPLQLTVLPAEQAVPGDAEIFMEVEAEPRDPRVQQQVRYTVRLYYALTLLEGDLAEPDAEGVEVMRLGPDTSFQRNIGQRRYNVVERRYALFPQRSGRVEVEAPRFRGRALGAGQRGWMGRDRVVSARGDAVVFDVGPRADDGQGPWLPADQLTLEDVSGELPERVELGAPVTLSLRLRARGLSAAQLPELAIDAPDGARFYPDQPSTRESHDGPWLVAESERRFALVPQRTGVLEVPPVRLRWWNTRTGQAQTAELPGWRFEVVDPGGASGADAGPGDATDAAPAGTGATAPGWWPMLSLALGLGWLLTALSWWLMRGRVPAPAPQPEAPTAPDLRAARRQLDASLSAGDAPGITAALLQLARASGHGGGLDGLAGALEDPAQAEAVRALQRWRFAPDAEGDAALARLREAFSRPPAWRAPRDAAAAQASGSDPLPPLYPR